MGNALAFDTYAYVKKLRDAGLTEQQAAIQAEALVSLIEERLATKKDLATVEAGLKRDIAAVDANLKQAVKELDAKIEATKAELKRDIKDLDVKIEETKAELKRDIKDLDAKIEINKAELKRDFKEMEYRMVIKLGGLTIVAVGLIMAMLRLWPIPTQYAPPPGHEMRGSASNSGER